MKLFNFFCRKKHQGKQYQNNVCYNEIIESGYNKCCYCRNFSSIQDNSIKILECYNTFEANTIKKIIENVNKIVQEIPSDFPHEQITLTAGSQMLEISDRLHRSNLSPTCSAYEVWYTIYCGENGMGWSIQTCDFMGDLHIYNTNDGSYIRPCECNSANIRKFLEHLFSAMGYYTPRY